MPSISSSDGETVIENIASDCFLPHLIAESFLYAGLFRHRRFTTKFRIRRRTTEFEARCLLNSSTNCSFPPTFSVFSKLQLPYVRQRLSSRCICVQLRSCPALAVSVIIISNHYRGNTYFSSLSRAAIPLRDVA